MKSRFSLAAILVIVAVQPVLTAPRPKADKDDLVKFEGAWVFTSWEHYGRGLDEDSRQSAKWLVKGDKYKFEIDGVEEEGTVKLDPSQKVATIDLAITEGNDKGKEQVGIYKVDGDTITMCFARPGVKERPTDFTSTADNSNILVTIKKQKKDD
jgi:uncharacterized protein (TIGR03067 family)